MRIWETDDDIMKQNTEDEETVLEDRESTKIDNFGKETCTLFE